MCLGNKSVCMTGASKALVAVLLVACVACSPRTSQTGAASAGAAVTARPKFVLNTGPRESTYHPTRIPPSARFYYQSVWGVDNLLVRVAASGSLVRFSYRVTDPKRAAVLADKHAKPAMYDPRSRRILQIPVLEQVGALWQAGVEMKMEKGKEYWMTFSNKGQPVKPGDRVTVVIGSFRAEGLMVEED